MFRVVKCILIDAESAVVIKDPTLISFDVMLCDVVRMGSFH